MQKIIFLSFVLTANLVMAQNIDIPSSYSNILADENGIYLKEDDKRHYAVKSEPQYNLKQLFGKPEGTSEGVKLDFGDFQGTITYGLIPYGKAPHPLPVFRFVKTLESGIVDINIKRDFRYPYDFVD